MFDIATPNPTGSLSGPWFDVTGSGNVTGVRGRNSHLACRVKNLANQTVSQQKICLRPFARYRRILAAPQRTKVDAKKFALSKSAQLTKITFLVSSLEFPNVPVQKLFNFGQPKLTFPSIFNSAANVGVQSCKVSMKIRGEISVTKSGIFAFCDKETCSDDYCF